MSFDGYSDFIGAVRQTLETARAARDLFGPLLRGRFGPPARRYPTPKALARAVSRGEIGLGASVEISGLLSRYAHLYKPISWTNAVVDHARSERMRRDVAVGGGMRKASAGMSWRAAQNPVATLPRLTVDGESIRCMFLYSNLHDTFIYHKAMSRDDDLRGIRLGAAATRSPRVAIPEQARPIPVLMNAEEALTFAERKVRLTAAVRELPVDLGNRFASLYAAHYDPSVLSNFLLANREPPIAFFLEPMETSFEDKRTDIELRSVIYVEGHIDQVDLGLEPSEVAKIIPRQDGIATPVMVVGGREALRTEACPDDITATIIPGGIIGFYAETGPTRPAAARFEQIASLVHEFGRRANKEFGHDFATDFLTDYERQRLFEPSGVLAGAALSALMNDEGLRSTVDWLRGEA